MEKNEVLEFVTQKQRLDDAAGLMMLKYYDYTDNTGSEYAREFWNDFEDARNAYRKVRDEYNGTAEEVLS